LQAGALVATTLVLVEKVKTILISNNLHIKL